jgi:hypothetical protein
VKKTVVRLLLTSFLLTLGLLGSALPTNAAVSSSPTLELDASNPSSLATAGATSWRDLVSGGTVAAALSGNAAYSSAGGGSLAVSGVSGYGGAAFPASAVGTVTNPSGDMSLMMWVKFSSWNAEWNLLASQWFTNATGSEVQNWHFASRVSGANRYLNLYTTNKSNMFGTTALALNTWYQVGFTLTSAGSLQFYINGVAEGSVITGATRTANTSSQLWVGDARSNCVACSMNGNISRFRMWNSILNSATVLNDFNFERENFGYAPFVTSASFSLASNSPVYRVLNTITATVPLNSRVTFYENKKVISGCKRVVPTSTTAICRWKPSTHGAISVRVSYTNSGSATVNWAPTTSLFGSKRTGTR